MTIAVVNVVAVLGRLPGNPGGHCVSREDAELGAKANAVQTSGKNK